MEFEDVVNGRPVTVEAQGCIDDLYIIATDKETGLEIKLSHKDECRLWQRAYDSLIDDQLAFVDSLRDKGFID